MHAASDHTALRLAPDSQAAQYMELMNASAGRCYGEHAGQHPDEQGVCV